MEGKKQKKGVTSRLHPSCSFMLALLYLSLSPVSLVTISTPPPQSKKKYTLIHFLMEKFKNTFFMVFLS